MGINKEIDDFKNNKIIYILKLREILANDILIGNNKNLINILKQGNINITNFYINSNQIGYGNYCLWLFYEYDSNTRMFNELYECLISNRRNWIHKSNEEMRNRLINDLNISDINNNNCYYNSRQKLDKNLFDENDYVFNDNKNRKMLKTLKS